MSEPYRVVVVEDDLDVADYTKTVLEKRLGALVVAISDPRQARSAIEQLQPDVVITDIEMPGASGLELMATYKEARPGVAIIVMTAHVSVDYAVGALRNQADEFLTKPVSTADLVSNVSRLADAAREAWASAPERQVVLAIGAHPDDVEIGVGGIMAAHRAAGDSVTILTLSKGTRDGGIRTAWEEGSSAAAIIGATLVLEDSAEPQLSSSEPTVSIIKRVISDLRPTVVYVHSNSDRHQDHRAVHDATILATSEVRTIACYQSSTATVDFHPNRFVSIDGFTDTKAAMLECFSRNQKRAKYLQGEFALATARYWSRYGQGEHCEPLEIIRDSSQVS
ncbi:response regulator [Parafrigoribacterium humi]|uniref:response regulator n=1 Tax=Parafrigoribacterium humi TaxID=3144664 RepID=UPI0032EC761E